MFNVIDMNYITDQYADGVILALSLLQLYWMHTLLKSFTSISVLDRYARCWS
jgi:hypothetical protein